MDTRLHSKSMPVIESPQGGESGMDTFDRHWQKPSGRARVFRRSPCLRCHATFLPLACGPSFVRLTG